MNGFIYKITNDINDKIYIGKTLSSIEKRFNEHLKDSVRSRNNKRPLYNAMNKYGIDHFSVELIEEVPIENLSEREIYWIKQYNSYSNGYNATLGGEGKLIFNYDDLVIEYLNGSLVLDIAKKFNCCTNTVSLALSLAKIDSYNNASNKIKKGIIAKSKEGLIIEIFKSRKDAAIWLLKNNYTSSIDIDNITATIGRVANGKRKSAYNLFWENL